MIDWWVEDGEKNWKDGMKDMLWGWCKLEEEEEEDDDDDMEFVGFSRCDVIRVFFCCSSLIQTKVRLRRQR